MAGKIVIETSLTSSKSKAYIQKRSNNKIIIDENVRSAHSLETYYISDLGIKYFLKTWLTWSRMTGEKHVITFAFIALTNIYISASLHKDTTCRPFPVMVQTDSIFPKDSFIIVHQCRGGPEGLVDSNKQCVNETAKPTGRKTIEGVEIYNHTKCNTSTVCNNNLNPGENPDPNTRPGVCYFHETWNAKDCKCETKTVNAVKACKDDPKKSSNIGSRPSTSIGLNLFIIALVGELIVVVSIAYIIRRWRKSQNNSTYDLTESGLLEKNEFHCTSSKIQQRHEVETDV